MDKNLIELTIPGEVLREEENNRRYGYEAVQVLRYYSGDLAEHAEPL